MVTQRFKSLVAAAARVLTPDGSSVNTRDLKEPQTADRIALQREFQGHPSRGLTPSKLAQIMDSAEQGDIMAQYELYEDMEEKDAHIMAEMGKRRRAVAGLDWSIVPPRNPTAKEKNAARELQEVIAGLEDFAELMFDVTDGIGKAFCCLEIEWRRSAGFWLPKSVQHRPQTWFQFKRGYTQEIRLRGPADGEPLQPFGWIVHTHKAKSGWLERSALFRVLAWPYLFKNYSVGDLAEFLEIYGIPLRLGKYPSGATQKEKLTLMRALAMIGHNAAGIIPQGMDIEFQKAADGDPGAFQLMMEWCDKAQSKAILGGTLTSQADGASSTNALGNVHNEVRKELTDSDAKQIQKTLTRDLVWPIAVLNGLATEADRCPCFVFDTSEREDMAQFAKSVPALVNLGFRVPRQWAHERVGIPEPEDDEDILQPVKRLGANPPQPPAMATAALNRQREERTMADDLDDEMQTVTDEWIDRIRALVNDAESLDQVRDGLLALLPEMDIERYADLMAEALRVAELTGRDDIMEEANGGAART
ncbi:MULTISPECIES: DUF935 domain-containing protein [unclassified Marinimicrobium]|jgi:phage gp29-like protein|uniref:DUF935 domain-containing protein n=3 Tax=Marinimicrobium TaxID=359337 RepID=UPI000C6AA571|nr:MULTISPECIES: DUF935 domain-containing protein [unclassified Marinimicrobium]MAN51206.1 hypothetical protein [Marinimicrobium sp.]|tara:strand:+ start:775 stop:2373 length:1599 start_codon:yes stop_codon:yes gene_type:complete